MKRYSSDEVALLREAYAKYYSKLNTITSEDNIASFLCTTESIKIPESRRLIGLAAALTHELGWSGICEIYRYALRRGERREGIYINWLACATELLQKTTQDSSRESSRKVVDDSLEVLNDALQEHPGHDGFAYLTGYFNFIYTDFCQQEPTRYTEALTWFRQAEQWQIEYYGEVDNRIKFYLGQCYLALKQWKNALKSYASVDAELLAREEGDKHVSELKEGVAIANAAIIED